ncbi:MAG: hypothetical protein M5U28_02180 [Sandaracinaceae bacterium]|nr:hypothetical protein [Sandaracinaceae bacterium]
MQGLIRWLLPREDHFFEYLERQAVVAHEAALALQSLAEGDTPEQVADVVQEDRAPRRRRGARARGGAGQDLRHPHRPRGSAAPEPGDRRHHRRGQPRGALLPTSTACPR